MKDLRKERASTRWGSPGSLEEHELPKRGTQTGICFRRDSLWGASTIRVQCQIAATTVRTLVKLCRVSHGDFAAVMARFFKAFVGFYPSLGTAEETVPQVHIWPSRL